jgi:hypothetical protein
LRSNSTRVTHSVQLQTWPQSEFKAFWDCEAVLHSEIRVAIVLEDSIYEPERD